MKTYEALCPVYVKAGVSTCGTRTTKGMTVREFLKSVCRRPLFYPIQMRSLSPKKGCVNYLFKNWVLCSKTVKKSYCCVRVKIMLL